MPIKKKTAPKPCAHPSDAVDWQPFPELNGENVRYYGTCDCGVEVAEDYMPTGEIYAIA